MRKLEELNEIVKNSILVNLDIAELELTEANINSQFYAHFSGDTLLNLDFSEEEVEFYNKETDSKDGYYFLGFNK